MNELWAPAVVLGGVALCRMACVELDECTTVPLGLPGNHLVKGGRT